MLRLFAIVLVFGSVLSGFTMVSAQSDVDPIEYIVIGETANIRSEPSTVAAIIGSAAQGDSLLIIDEEPNTDGWLRIYQYGGFDQDAYIADFLVERAPQRFYSLTLQPIHEVSGRGSTISDVLAFPRGVYRLDALVQDRSFILRATGLEDGCRERILFNEIDFDRTALTPSTLLVIPSDCSYILESENVRGEWSVEIRDITQQLIETDELLELQTGTTISGIGTALTMGTLLDDGMWAIRAEVEDSSFILWARASGDCSEENIFNEIDFDVTRLSVAALYSVDGPCHVFWEISNVRGEWSITFERMN